MIHTEITVRTLQAVAMTVGIALFLWSTGLPTFFRTAEAASITNASDTLSNSAPNVVSNHTIVFDTENGLTIGQTITVTFPVGVDEFVMGSVDEGDVGISIDGNASSTAASSGAGVWGVDVTGGVITLTTPTDYGVASSSEVTILIGTNAPGGANQITNPSISNVSYMIEIGGTMQDSGQVRVAIVDQVQVSASVDASLTFNVSGVADNQSVNGSPTTTVATSTATTLPFGTLPVGQSLTLAHDLSVTTNAKNGFTVTVEQSGPLQSTTGGIIDGFVGGSPTAIPLAWESPAGLIANTATYGHWGLTSSDTIIDARTSQFGSDQWVSASTTPVAIFGHDGPADGLEPGQGLARIGYQIEITALQEAGDDYTTTLRYIATPTF
jgi:hypothetical protein